MKHKILCDTCAVESETTLLYDEPPNFCPYCGAELSDDEIEEVED